MKAWMREATRLLERFTATQTESVEQASELCASAIGTGAVVYTFGTGHSRIAVEEMFPRYCSYSGFVPMVELSTSAYTNVTGANGLLQAMHVERQSGLAEIILRSWNPRPPAAMMVFSASGAHAVPVELAAGARSRGLPVIAVTSVEQTRASEPAHPAGTRLIDHADVVVDVCGSDIDGLAHPVGAPAPIGPATTLGYVCAVNAIKVRTAELLIQRSALPPVISHAGAVGPEASAESISNALADHARRVRGQGSAEVGPAAAPVTDEARDES